MPIPIYVIPGSVTKICLPVSTLAASTRQDPRHGSDLTMRPLSEESCDTTSASSVSDLSSELPESRKDACLLKGCVKGTRVQGRNTGQNNSIKNLALSGRRNQKTCSEPNCSNKAHNRGLCRKHDPIYAHCIAENCTNQAHVISGWCRKHNPKIGRCKAVNCMRMSVSSRCFCKKHDPLHGTCLEPGCLNLVSSRGLCHKHYQRMRRVEKKDKLSRKEKNLKKSID